MLRTNPAHELCKHTQWLVLVPSVYYTSSLAHIRIHLLRHWATCATTSTFYAARYSLHHHSGSLSGKRLKSESQQTVRCAQMKAFVIILHAAHISQTRTLHSTGSSWRLQLQRITCLSSKPRPRWLVPVFKCKQFQYQKENRQVAKYITSTGRW